MNADINPRLLLKASFDDYSGFWSLSLQQIGIKLLSFNMYVFISVTFSESTPPNSGLSSTLSEYNVEKQLHNLVDSYLPVCC